ncbi:CLI_3235 family bacteriocin precursor [Clostridium beijerinckii]|uniref:CLI_3235 family bacteriocin precursor n=1 Tax=Clostridium beijerinckii TaxID=1520 RepID=UPI00156F5ABE|nr:CLI_3235 family bacteriocin precursor [Clostridium beijerinckii]NRT74803.1 putative bacteriocin precursor [Clostridium beijerinckii]
MKKLGKNNTSEANTIQAYSCTCSCGCSCWKGNWSTDTLGAGVGATISVGNDAKTLSILN